MTNGKELSFEGLVQVCGGMSDCEFYKLLQTPKTAAFALGEGCADFSAKKTDGGYWIDASDKQRFFVNDTMYKLGQQFGGKGN